MLYIHYKLKEEEVLRGPYYSLTPDGTGIVINQNWTAYRAVDANGNISRVIIPVKYHLIASW